MHQNKPYPADLKKVTPSSYVRDGYKREYPSIVHALRKGLITAYAGFSVEEDMAEIVSTYITNTPEYWNDQMRRAGAEGAALINQKLSIISQYYHESWNIDLNALRSSVIKHQNELNTIDLNQL